MTGPSLAGLFGRKAGSLASFSRYSPAMKAAQHVWDDGTLDTWLTDPAAMIPGNRMTFPGIKDARAREDLLVFLKDRTALGRAGESNQSDGMMDDAAPNLRQLTPKQRVAAISHCRDTYRVTTSDGQTMDYWERNLRFKTDTSDIGPVRGAPAAWIKPSC